MSQGENVLAEPEQAMPEDPAELDGPEGSDEFSGGSAEPTGLAEPAGLAESAQSGEPARSGESAEEQAAERAEPEPPDLELEGEIAADYIEGLLDVADLDGDIDMDVEGDRAVVSVVGATLDELVGHRGEVLDALQELTRLAVHRHTGGRTRLMLDIGGYRAQRRLELSKLGADAADEVGRTGEAKALAAMNAFERKIVHDAIAAAGLRSESEGIDPNRRVVVLPAS